MTLIIDDETFASVLTMAPCIEALDTAFREYTPGGAVNRPRSHTYTRLDDGRHYLFKSMDGGIASLGVHAIPDVLRHDARSSSGAQAPTREGARSVRRTVRGAGHALRHADPRAAAIMQDDYLQRMRAHWPPGTSPSPAPVRSAGGYGVAGRAQLLGMHACGDIAEYRVYSTDADRCRTLLRGVLRTARTTHRTRGQRAGSGRERGHRGVGNQLTRPGDRGVPAQTGSARVFRPGSRARRRTLDRADILVVRSREEATIHHAPGEAPLEASERKQAARGHHDQDARAGRDRPRPRRSPFGG
jgi:hypothetical protein